MLQNSRFEVRTPRDPNLQNWPPSPGNLTILNKQGCVAVCTNATDHTLLDLKHPEIALVGNCVTVNPGLLRMITTIVTNPHIRFLLFCGERSEFKPDLILHQWIQNDPNGLPLPQTQTFKDKLRRLREQVKLIHLTLEEHKPSPSKILMTLLPMIQSCASQNPGKLPKEPLLMEAEPHVAVIDAKENPELVWDPLGHFIVKIENGYIVVEHYKAGTCELDCIIRGKTAKEVLHTVIQHKLFGEFSQKEQHIVYLGREVGKAETALLNGFKYVQSEPLIVNNKDPEQRGNVCK